MGALALPASGAVYVDPMIGIGVRDNYMRYGHGEAASFSHAIQSLRGRSEV